MNKLGIIRSAIFSVTKEEVETNKKSSYPVRCDSGAEMTDKQWKGASTYASCTREEVAVIVDETVFASGKSGAVFTENALYVSNGVFQSIPKQYKERFAPLRYESICSVEWNEKNHAYFTVKFEDVEIKVLASIHARYYYLTLKAILEAIRDETQAVSVDKSVSMEEIVDDVPDSKLEETVDDVSDSKLEETVDDVPDSETEEAIVEESATASEDDILVFDAALEANDVAVEAYEKGDYQAAIQKFSLAVLGGIESAVINLAICYLKMDDLKEAKYWLDRAEEYEGYSEELILQVKEAYAIDCHNLAVDYWSEDDYENALIWVNRAIDAGFSKSRMLKNEIEKNMIDIPYLQGLKAYNQDEFVDAIKYWEPLIKLGRTEKILMPLAISYATLEEWEPAKAWVKKAVEAGCEIAEELQREILEAWRLENSEYVNTLVDQATAYENAGKIDKAIEVYIKITEYSDMYYHKIAPLYIKAGDFKNAEIWAEKSLAEGAVKDKTIFLKIEEAKKSDLERKVELCLAKDSIDYEQVCKIYLSMGWLYEAKKYAKVVLASKRRSDVRFAKKALDEIKNSLDQKAVTAFETAKAAFKTGDYKTAIENYKIAAAAEIPEAHYNVAISYLKLGELEKAKCWAGRAIQAGDNGAQSLYQEMCKKLQDEDRNACVKRKILRYIYVFKENTEELDTDVMLFSLYADKIGELDGNGVNKHLDALVKKKAPVGLYGNAICYYHGINCKRNLERAEYYARKAVNQGMKYSYHLLEEIREMREC